MSASCPHLAGRARARSSGSAANGSRDAETLEQRKRRRLSMKSREELYYNDYLQLDKVLDAQKCESAEDSETGAGAAHDEHLFIVIHQTYELWFKQILHELDSVMNLFGGDHIPEKDVGSAVARLHRITEIQRVLLGQLAVLETMTPLGFLEFRDHLFPASGFQSVQFRLIENKLGLASSQRLAYGQRSYCSYLTEAHSERVREVEQQQSLHDLIEAWLERTPFVAIGSFNFWQHYRNAIQAMLETDREYVRGNGKISEEQRTEQLAEIDQSEEHYDTLLDASKYNKLRESGRVRLSHRAMQAALLISLYQDEPILNQASRILKSLVDIDELLTLWRYRHSLMVHRMLGIKMGTGGSSGFHYLRSSASQHRIFKDICNISTYLIAQDMLPPLPDEVKDALKFRAESIEGGNEGGGHGSTDR